MGFQETWYVVQLFVLRLKIWDACRRGSDWDQLTFVGDPLQDRSGIIIILGVYMSESGVPIASQPAVSIILLALSLPEICHS